jgi:ABC-type bacteriocin/lantibiotic exporter with double-glycine peptidase domain
MKNCFIDKNPSGSSLIKCASALFLIVIAVCMSSCLSMHGIHALSANTIIKDVPFYSQESYHCGPASLAMIMNYLSVMVKPEEIAEDIYSKSAHGTLNLDMVLYAQRKGLSALQYKGDLSDIHKNIGDGNPLIVMVDYGFSFYEASHFMVIVGYNEAGIIVNSGKKKDHFIPEKEFLKTWEKTNYWTLLIQRRDIKNKFISMSTFKHPPLNPLPSREGLLLNTLSLEGRGQG